MSSFSFFQLITWGHLLRLHSTGFSHLFAQLLGTVQWAVAYFPWGLHPPLKKLREGGDFWHIRWDANCFPFLLVSVPVITHFRPNHSGFYVPRSGMDRVGVCLPSPFHYVSTGWAWVSLSCLLLPRQGILFSGSSSRDGLLIFPPHGWCGLHLWVG